MISTHKRDLEDALAKKEKELMTDYALDKMNSSPDSTVQLEEKISELEKEIKFGRMNLISCYDFNGIIVYEIMIQKVVFFVLLLVVP